MRTRTGRRALRRLAMTAVVPLALGGLAACGDHDQTAAGPAPAGPSSVEPASGAPAAAKATPATRHEVDPAAFVALVRSGVTDLSTVKMSMSTTMDGQVITAKGAMDLTGSHPAMQMSMDLTGMGTPAEIRLVDGVVYVQTSPGGMFVTYDLGDSRSPLGDLSGSMSDLDPRSMISGLSPEAFRSVTDLGSATVGGQRVEHYQVVIDTRGSTSMLHPGTRGVPKLPKRLTYDLWLDDHHRMARFVMVLKKYLRITARYYDYGATVHVAAPPAARVLGAS